MSRNISSHLSHMIKIKFLVSLSFLFFPIVSHANWYGPAGWVWAVVQNGYFIQNKNLNTGGTWCSQDNDLTWWYPPNAAWNWGSPAPTQWNYLYDTRAYNHDATRMRCQRWDASLPEDVNITLTSWWTNANTVISVQSRDRGGSRLKRIVLQQSMNGWWWQNVWDWDNLTASNNTLVTRNWTRTVAGQNWNSFQYRILAYDYAGNQQSYTHPWIIRVDTQAPVAWDIQSILPINNQNLLAINSQNISFQINTNGGGPIVSIRGYFENKASSTWAYLTTPFTHTSWNFSQNFDISDVDLQRGINGGRQYSMKITQICDEAWNCTTAWNNSWNSAGIVNLTYNVYANTLNIWTNTVSTNPFASSIVADGVVKNLTVRLRDTYGNDIIPASGISRNVIMNFNTNNQLRLNQYRNSGSDSAFFVTDASTEVWVGNNITTSLGTQLSSNWDYTIPFYVFGPTNSSTSLVPWSLSINNIRFSTTWTLWPVSNIVVWNSNISIIANPLFTTTITGTLSSQWFIEGVSQTGSQISVTKANATTTTSNNLYFEFGNYNTGTLQNEANNRYDISLNSSWNIREWFMAGNPISTSISGIGLNAWNYNFSSRMLLQSWAVNTATTSYLASIVRYQVWSPAKTVIYPSDIIGKTAYHGVAGNNNSYQAWVKILGNTASKNVQEIVTDQFDGDVRILGNIEKPLARKDIQTRVYELIRNIPWDTTGNLIISTTNLQSGTWNDSSLQATALYWNAALYASTWVTLQGASNIEGNKTLIVEGDIYISGNLRDADNDALLWLIALSKNGKWWNIYINPDVTDIHAILYADKSVISANDMNANWFIEATEEYDGGNSVASDLNRQLYIKGSIFSENTIWGSRKNPIACPYFVNTGCDIETAQKYDLNYLRRYFRYDSDGNGSLDAQSWLQSFAWWSSRWSRSTEFQDYPVIIEYDSRIQQTPPPFFGN